jgi:LmbE family N-acetylglucosaminyl deacetylase
VGTWLGLRLVRDFRWSLDISDVTEAKRHALEQHRSQMMPLIEDVGWATLEGVSNGQFLACFFTEQEYFRAERRHG